MSDTIESPDMPQWYAIYTHPKQEERANSNLNALGVETFNPQLKVRRFNQFTGQPTYVIRSLFPRYFFARFDLSSLLRKVGFTRGVHSVVSVGHVPIPVDEEIINFIKSRENEEGFIRMGEEFKAGDKVFVNQGALRDLPGIFSRQIKNSDRVIILIASITFHAHVVVGRDSIEKAS